MTILFETKLLWNTVIDIPDVLAPVNLHSYYDSFRNSINLTWESRSPDETGQRIYRNLTPTPVENLGEPYAFLGAGITEYEDVSVTEGQVYYYYVSAVSGGNEAISAELRAKTILVPPFDISGEVEEVEEGDPHWDKVVSLLHLDGDLMDEVGGSPFNSEGAIGFTEEVTRFPNRRSAIFNGSRAYKSDISSFTLRGDFTWEVWVYPLSDQNSGLISISPKSTSNSRYGIDYRNSQTIRIVNANASPNWGDGVNNGGSGSLLIGKWSHVALTREGSQWRLFVDGILKATASAASNYSGNQPLNLGYIYYGGHLWFHGYMQEFRFTNGVCRYTENFTPPTAPFPNFGP